MLIKDETNDLLYRKSDKFNLRWDFEDIWLWPDKEWCYRDEVAEMQHKSDDYQILKFDSPEYNKLLDEINA